MSCHGPAQPLCALLLLLAICAPALSETQFGGDHEQEFHSLVWAWAQGGVLENKGLGMCVGESERQQWGMLQRSFPGKWPAKDSEDEFCADMGRGAAAICGQEDLAFYSEVLLRTNNPEKIPTRGRCGTTDKVKGCWPGFFEFYNVTRPCCDGFFCPSMLTCMIPCPMGAHCRRAKPRSAPIEFADGDWCDPYAYKAKEGTCGGADFWSPEPRRGFLKGQWELKDPSLFCPKGRYCTNTTSTPKICPQNYNCLQGSIKPTRCLPFIVQCEQGSDYPQGNFTGLVFVAVVVFGLLVFWQASKLCSLWSRKRNRQSQSNERLEMHIGIDVSSSQAAGTRRRRKVLAHVPQSGSPCQQSSISEEAQGICSRESPIRHDDLNLDPEKNMGDKELSTKSLGMFGEFSLDSAALGLNVSRIRIEFYGLSLQLKSSSKYVLRSASGVLIQSQLTAIMGPSGSGKTSLLNSLSGKATYGTVSGVVMMNGKEDKLEKYKCVMGFVPQDDIMHTDLTVEENLLFSAKYRLPAHTSHSSIMSAVERAIQVIRNKLSDTHVLGLNNVRHELIGNEETRGISGGQRKRVNVGLEIVADPLVLFLDEPTSGLDSSSCKQVVSALRTIAHLGVTTAAIVHQPSHRVMKLFDDLLLLGNMGSTVYNGPAHRAQEYFESLGFEFPSQANPIDIAMDIVMGQHGMQMNPDFQPYDLCILWIKNNRAPKRFTDLELENRTKTASLQFFSQLKENFGMETSDPSTASGKEWYRHPHAILSIASPRAQEFCSKTIGAVNECFEKAKGATVMERITTDVGQPGDISLIEYHRRTPGFFPQFWWCLCRAILKKFRSPSQLFAECITFATAGMALGYMTDMRQLENLFTFQKDSMYNFVGAGLLSSLAGLRAFGVSQNVFYRETARGINRLAYYLAVDTVGILSTTVHCLCYVLPYYYFMLPRTDFGRFYFIVVSMMFSWTGTAYITSQVMDLSAAQLTSAVMVLIHALIARPKQLSSGPRLWLRSALFTWWGSKAILISEAEKLEGVWLLERCMVMVSMGFSIDSFGHAMLVLISLGVLMRIVACVLLFTINRDKQI